MTLSRKPIIRRGLVPTVSLRQALDDPQLLGSVLAGDFWQAWRVLLMASMGEELTEDERLLFRQLTRREHEPGKRVEELVVVAGRRGGKSRAISVLATYIAGLCEHPALVPGERGIVLTIGPDLRQADIVLDYVEANFRKSPILRQLVASRTARVLSLTTGVDIEVRSSDSPPPQRPDLSRRHWRRDCLLVERRKQLQSRQRHPQCGEAGAQHHARAVRKTRRVVEFV